MDHRDYQAPLDFPAKKEIEDLTVDPDLRAPKVKWAFLAFEAKKVASDRPVYQAAPDSTDQKATPVSPVNLEKMDSRGHPVYQVLLELKAEKATMDFRVFPALAD